MPLPVRQTDHIDKVFEGVQREAEKIADFCSGARTALAQGSVSANAIVQVATKCVAARKQFSRGIQNSKLQDHAKSQFSNPNLDYIGELTLLRTAVSNVINEVAALISVDENGYILKDKFIGGELQTDSFTIAQTSILRNKLDQVVAGVA